MGRACSRTNPWVDPWIRKRGGPEEEPGENLGRRKASPSHSVAELDLVPGPQLPRGLFREPFTKSLS